jgi:hypothetical protein
LRKKNENLLEKVDQLKESNAIEQEEVSKQKTDMKVEIKSLHETVKKMEADMEEQKTEYLHDREVRKQELTEAEAEISTMALSTKVEEDFRKLMKVLKQIGVSGKGKQSGQEKPESQILNTLEWYNTAAIAAMVPQNYNLRHTVNRLTRSCVRPDRGFTETKDDDWDMAFQMMIEKKEIARMSAEGIDRIRRHDEELEQARADVHTRIKTNVHFIRQLQGNSYVVKNKTLQAQLQRDKDAAESYEKRQMLWKGMAGCELLSLTDAVISPATDSDCSSH